MIPLVNHRPHQRYAYFWDAYLMVRIVIPGMSCTDNIFSVDNQRGCLFDFYVFVANYTYNSDTSIYIYGQHSSGFNIFRILPENIETLTDLFLQENDSLSVNKSSVKDD